MTRAPEQTVDDLKFCTPMYQSPWALKELRKVMFLADAEPRLALQFGSAKPESIIFASDAERQRWRRHLANVLRYQEEHQTEDQGKSNNTWSVVRTGKTETSEVQKMVTAKRA